MRTVTYGAAASLDGFIARPDHTADWLQWTDEIASITAAYWKTIDTVIMGRKTYDAAAALGTSVYPGVRNYVCSRTMTARPHPDVEVVSDDAATFVRGLKAGAGKGICIMGGGEIANALFAADLIDEVGVNVHPVLLGTGIPMFLRMTRQLDLILKECRPLGNGCVLVMYVVKR